MKTKVAKIGEKAEKSLSFVERNGTAIVVTIGVVAVGFLAYKIVSSLTKAVSNATKDNDAINKTGQNLNSRKATISREVARNLASELLGAMDRNGTDEDQIYRVFEVIGDNSDNFLLVHQEFGQKYYNGQGQPPNGLWRFTDLGLSEPQNLVYWLREELNASERKKIAPVIRKAGFAF